MLACLKSFDKSWKVLKSIEKFLRSVVILSAKSFIVPTMSGSLISIECLNMFPTYLPCFRVCVLPPRSSGELALRPNMILASNFIGLILLATSQLFVPLVQGDRVSDAIDSGKVVFIVFIFGDPDLYYQSRNVLPASRAKTLNVLTREQFLPDIL